MPLRAQALRSRLPTLATPAAALLRKTFAQPLQWREGDLVLSLAHASPTPPEAAQIESPHGLARLWVASSSWRDDAGDRPWQDYEGDSRSLAWALTHETLLRKLGTLLGCEFGVKRLIGSSSNSPLALRWMLRENDQHAGGWLQAEPDLWLQHWLPLARPVIRPSAFVAASLPAHLSIELPMPGFPVADLAASGAGDVLVLGARSRVWSSLNLRHGEHHRWLASWDRGVLRVLGPMNPKPYLEEPAMSQDVPPEATPSNAPQASAVDSMNVDLSFMLGNLKLSVGELANLSPGYIFDLPNRLEQAQVLIQAGGRTIGRGELVAIGETLGVQISELKLDGLQ